MLLGGRNVTCFQWVENSFALMKKIVLLGPVCPFRRLRSARNPPAPTDQKQIEALLKAVQAQQTQIAENQAKIDAKLVDAGGNDPGRKNLLQPRRPLNESPLPFRSARAGRLRAHFSSQGQAPAPVVLQAANAPAPAATPATAPRTAAPAADDDAAAMKRMIQQLQAMQAANADTIKKQEMALETLDGLQKSAEEIKIFSKRG